MRWYERSRKMPRMPVRTLSVALDEDIAARARASARAEGVSLSAWLDRAARRALTIERGLAAVRDWEAEHGAFSTDELERADAALDRDRRAARRRRP